MKYQILLYYRYVHIDDPARLAEEQRAVCQKLKLKGRIIVAHEGINGTLEGDLENTEKYIAWMLADTRFADTDFKKSTGTGAAFPKLSIKVRDEIVSGHLGPDDLNPLETTGKYLTAEELHAWIHGNKEFYIVDMRNDYEHAVGFFKNSILPPLKNFRDLSNILPSLQHLKDKTVVTVCTGGVRCEKASGFLLKHGFTDVYQLQNGIVTYMEKYPNEDFLGKLYVFDGRVVMGFHLDDPKHTIVGKCLHCGHPCDRYVDCALLSCKQPTRHYVCCYACEIKTALFCSRECRESQAIVPA